MRRPSSRARRDDLNAHSTTWGRLSPALNRRVLTPVRRTSSETNSEVFAIFVGMIARGAGIDATIPSTLASNAYPDDNAHSTRARGAKPPIPAPFRFFPALNVCGRRQRDPLLAAGSRTGFAPRPSGSRVRTGRAFRSKRRSIFPAYCGPFDGARCRYWRQTCHMARREAVYLPIADSGETAITSSTCRCFSWAKAAPPSAPRARANSSKT